MESKHFTRRDFFKVLGLGAGVLLSSSLIGCAEEKEDSQIIKDNNLSPTGNTTIKKAYTHLIWVYEVKGGSDISNEVKGEIRVPEGYEYVGSESVIPHNGTSGFQTGIKYNYVNAVDVEVAEYINDETREICYPFAGTPLEKIDDLPKVLIKTE